MHRAITRDQVLVVKTNGRMLENLKESGAQDTRRGDMETWMNSEEADTLRLFGRQKKKGAKDFHVKKQLFINSSFNRNKENETTVSGIALRFAETKL